jgi:mannosyltransferase OCH1-like enzyme
MIIVANRITKIIGVLIKLFSYVFHFFFPTKRFSIPLSSPAIIKSNSKTVIPKILWQTNFTNKVSLPVYLNYLFNRLMSLSYEYRYVGDDECYEMIKRDGTNEEFSAFGKLKDGAAKADFWRVFALNKFGGVYLDLDAQLVWPLSKIIKANDKELFVRPRRDLYTNYFIAAKENHPILEDTIKIIIENIKNIDNLTDEQKSVFFITGPSAVIEAIGEKNVNYKIYKIVCSQGSFTNEHFQYIDKKNGKWIHTSKEDILK